ncbi:hypothetical protein PMAC_000769 [Pneumocystis sp. 'macacae']|nr:hypothetical protein PMAC_000769 [Pneumocystis sp. 'macacae']
MDTESQKNTRLNVQKENTLKGKQYRETLNSTEDAFEEDISSFYDAGSTFYQDASLSFESIYEPFITQKKPSNRFDYIDREMDNKSLISLDDNFSKKTETSDSSFDISFLDHLSNLNNLADNKTIIENRETGMDDIFGVFNRPVQDFIQNNIPNNGNSYFQQNDLLSNSEENNKYKSLENGVIMKLIDMGFNYEQIIRAIKMTEKTDIDSIISVLMTLNLLDDEKKQKRPQGDYIIDNRKGSCLMSDSQLSSTLFNKANSIFNHGKIYFQKIMQNSTKNPSIYTNPEKIPEQIKHKSSFSNQESLKKREKSNETIHKTLVPTVENYNDFLDFSSDKPNQALSYTQFFKKTTENTITQKHQCRFGNFRHCSKDFPKNSFEPICESLFFEGEFFSSNPKPESFKQQNLDISSSLINQLSTKRELALNAFNNGNYSKALELYTEAIGYLPPENVLKILFLANRSLCYLRMGDPEACLLDCDETLKLIVHKRDIQGNILFGKSIDHIWKKIVIRRAQSLQQLKRFKEAKCQWEEVINANIDYSKAIDAKNYCERALDSNILIDVDPLESSENQIYINTKETSCRYSDKKDALHMLAEIKSSERAHINILDSEDEKKILYDEIEQHINKWIKGKEGNLRALISTLDQVLWTSLGWENINMANLLSTSQVKKAYIKAISKIHPDKLPKNTSLKQKMIASSIFNLLNHAWNTFKKQNNI